MGEGAAPRQSGVTSAKAGLCAICFAEAGDVGEVGGAFLARRSTTGSTVMQEEEDGTRGLLLLFLNDGPV